MPEVPLPQGAPPPTVPPPAHLQSRTVPWRHALAWYEDAMRLVKRAPATWGLLAFVTLVTEIAVEAIPDVGPMLGKIVVPLVACGMLYAAAATDRGAAPSHAARGGRLSRTCSPPSAPSSRRPVHLRRRSAGGVVDRRRQPAGNGTRLRHAVGAAGRRHLRHRDTGLAADHVRAFPRAVRGGAGRCRVRGELERVCPEHVPLLVYAAASLVLLGFGLATMGIGLDYRIAALGRVVVCGVEGHIRRQRRATER